MLLRVIFENFLSFNKSTAFDMFPNPKRTSLVEHVYVNSDIPLLKMAAIYGPNGSGKSNFVKGLNLIKMFATKKDYLDLLRRNGDYTRLFYCLKEKLEPIKFLIEFSNADCYFVYSVKLSTKGIEEEKLYKSGLGEKENTLIYMREGGEVIFGTNGSDTIVTATKRLLKMNPYSSLLSLNNDFPIIDDKSVKIAYGWFASKLDVIGINSQLPELIEIVRKDKALMDFTNKVFQACGIGIKNLSVEEEDFETWAKKHSTLASKLPELGKNMGLTLFNENKQAYSVFQDKVYHFMFLQEGINGFEGELDTLSQSDGTLRLLTLIPALYRAIKKDQTIIIDEINNCLHPTIVEGIVKLFAQDNTSKGQIIFTTHDVDLMDIKDVLRSDEIWFADKLHGETVMYSHNDFKEHHTISKGRGYREGRFGAIRYMKTNHDKIEIH